KHYKHREQNDGPYTRKSHSSISSPEDAPWEATVGTSLKQIGVGRKILKLGESCTLNSKFEIGDWTGRVRPTVQFQTSDFEFQMQDSSNFKSSVSPCSLLDIQSEVLVVLVTNVFD